VQGLFITLDPARDTAQLLAQYVPAFDPSFIGLRGDAQATAAAAADFKVFFAPQKPDARGNYTIDHSGGTFVFDPQGRLRLNIADTISKVQFTCTRITSGCRMWIRSRSCP
jgi:protein SCO1/2